MVKLNRRKTCECGCGQIVKPGRRYICHHNNARLGTGKPKRLPQLCQCGCGEMTNWNKTFIVGHNRRGAHNAPKHNKNISSGKKGKPLLTTRGRKKSLDTRQKISARKKGKPSPMKNKHHKEESKRKTAISIKASWKRHTEEEKRNRIIKSCTCWAKPNKPETFLLNLLNKLYPNQWEYCGNFKIVINGKCPDFINISGQKKIIELFGDHWHKGQNPQDRIDVFKPYGYDTLVIWERELKDIEWVKFRIHKFTRRQIK